MGPSAGSVAAFRLVVRWDGVRVVLDTNLFVAAYWSERSASAQIIGACEDARLRMLFSPAIRAELFRVLRNARTSAAFQQRAAYLLAAAEEVHPTLTVRLTRDDPEDDKFLECALSGEADYIITNDDHLLRLGSVEGVQIAKPGEFVRRRLEADAP